MTTLNVDDKYAPLQALIKEIPRRPTINLASVSEHFPDIEKRI